MEPYDCIVIGAGQSGLYMAKALADKKFRYLVIERGCIGESWKRRMKGMRLFTSRQFCGLPGLPFPGEQQGFPTVDEMAEYLSMYANVHKLSLLLNTTVSSLRQQDDLFHFVLGNGVKVCAKTVVNATGSNQIPNIPSISQNLSEDIVQITASVKDLNVIEDNCKVVVVGDGASGRQIAAHLANRCKVTLACGKKRSFPPNVVLGKDIFWWLGKLGILSADTHSPVASFIRARNPVPVGKFNNARLRRLNVSIKPRLENCFDDELFFQDNTSDCFDAVVWASGYKDDTHWLNIDGCVNDKGFVQSYGKTPAAGMFLVGRKWLSCRASELVMGVERDVELVLKLLTEYLKKEEHYNA